MTRVVDGKNNIHGKFSIAEIFFVSEQENLIGVRT
jgi:hypothetical protein